MFSDGLCLGRWKFICMPNFSEISQSMAEIKLLPVSENGRPPYWNSISGFDFVVCVVIVMSFYICPPNSVVNGRSAVELWRHIKIFKMAAVFRFGDVICLRRWKSICNFCMPNFNEMFRKTDGRNIGFLFPVSISTYMYSLACHFTSACQIS